MAPSLQQVQRHFPQVEEIVRIEGDLGLLRINNPAHPFTTHRVGPQGLCLSGTYHATLDEALEVFADRMAEILA
jgi:hypothetical protein